MSKEIAKEILRKHLANFENGLHQNMLAAMQEYASLQAKDLQQQLDKAKEALSNISDIVSLLPIRASYLNDIRRIANEALSSIEGAEKKKEGK